MEIPTYFYAYLQREDGMIEKKQFNSRKEARDYISSEFEKHPEYVSCWTD